jgi:hypothetical protein
MGYWTAHILKGGKKKMNSRRIMVLAALLAVAILCGCVGYFHFHPIKSTEQEKVVEPGAKLFSSESGAVPVTPVISAVPASEESLIK